MPDKMSAKRTNALCAVGARVELCRTMLAAGDARSYYSVSRRLAAETPNAVLANQFYNPAKAPGA